MSMRARAAVCLAGIAAGLVAVLPVLAAPSCGIVIPAYFDDPSSWDDIASSASTVRAAIFNPGNGPGAVRSDAEAALASRARAAGVTVLGYVDTNRGRREVSVVNAEVDAYRTWYDVDGVFYDRASAGADQLAYYRSIAGHARGAGALVVALNPGSPPDAGYAGIGDLIVTFEGSAGAQSSATGADWMRSYPASKFVHLVYGAGTVRSMWTVRARARSMGAGNVYVTDDAPPNPWDRLPRYLRLEAALARAC